MIGEFDSPEKTTAADYTAFLQSNFGSLSSTILKYYPLSLFASTPFPPFYAISTVYAVASYFCPARRGLNATINSGVPAWTYRFAHTPTCGWEPGINSEQALELLGPTHTSEIPFVFAQLNNLPPRHGTCSFDEREVAISRALVSAWTSMAASGNPDGAVGITEGLWPKFNLAQSKGLLIRNFTSVGYINFTPCELWDKVNAEIVSQQAMGNGSSAGQTSATATGTASATGRGTSSGPMASSTSGTVALQVGFPMVVGLLLSAVFAV